MLLIYLLHKIFTIARSIVKNTIKMPHNPSLARHERAAREMDVQGNRAQPENMCEGDGEDEHNTKNK